jgi:hypothetical protein
MKPRLYVVAAILGLSTLTPAFAQYSYQTTTVDPLSTSSTTTTTVQESVPVGVPSAPVIVTPAPSSQTTIIEDRRRRHHLMRLGLPGLFHVNVL